MFRFAIRPSDLDLWLGIHERRLKIRATIDSGCLKQLFELAVNAALLTGRRQTRPNPWKSRRLPRRLVPTVDQFEAIVKSIRSQPYNRGRRKCGLCGVPWTGRCRTG